MYAPKMVLYSRQWVDVETAEDCVQDVFVQLMLQRRWPERLDAWLFRSVRNEVVNVVRRNARQRRRAASVERRPNWFKLDEKELVDVPAVQAAITGLNEDVREVLMLRVWAQLPFDEIASITGISATTAFRRFKEGLRLVEVELKQASKSTQPHVSTDRPRVEK
jgi:RNA polymerase sigma-70 factor, ECF subfamily